MQHAHSVLGLLAAACFAAAGCNPAGIDSVASAQGASGGADPASPASEPNTSQVSSGERPSTGTPSSQAEAVGGAADDAQGDPQAQQASEESEQERPGRWAGLLRLLAGRRASAKAGVEGRDPAIAIFEEQAATQALQEAKALLVADVEALVTRFDALKRGVQQASPRARARLERSVRDLGVEVDQVRRKVTSLRVVPSNDGAYRQGSLELRVQWLKERLRQAEAAWRSPRAEVPLAARAASRVSRVPLAR